MRAQGFLRAGFGFLILLSVLTPLCRADAPAQGTAKLVPALGWDAKKQGGFPVSIASDAAGNIWVGTEGNGIWKYDPLKKAWTQFTTKDGLGDDCVYALAVDGLNRVWAGHLNHGVSVYNGDKWKNYGLLEGPIGDRVFAIAVSPRDGDVWMASDMGLARYSEKRQDWDYYTRASGLPSDQVECLAFDSNGQLYAGTQCNGIAIAGPGDDYAKWRSVTADNDPRTTIGQGLASDLINGLQSVPVSDNNCVVAALTPSGASATPDGEQWIFIRSLSLNQPAVMAAMPGFVEPGQFKITLPLENWITALGSAGPHVWVGYRKAGVESRNPKDPRIQELVANVDHPGTVIIRSMLILPDEPPLFAAYDEDAGGLLTLDNAPPFKPLAGGTNRNATAPSLPSPAPMPILDDAKALAARLGKLGQQIGAGEAFYLADDWRTGGDWIGRYGSGYVKLCGMSQNGDQDYSLQPGYGVSLEVGPHHEANAAGPAWFHDDDTSNDLRSLYDPTLGHRRDAEENDVSYDTKTYPESYDGPDLWVKAKVPEGVHCLSLYFLNNDAHTKGGNKYRDYDVQIFSDENGDGKVDTGAPLARTRVTDFWGGVYKQFLVAGPASYAVRIGRNRSFVTKLQGVFLDPVTVEPADTPGQLPGFDSAPFQPPDEPDNYHPTPLTDAAITLWNQLDDALGLRGAVTMQMPLRIWCYRAAIAGQAPPEILERWRWQISIWTADDRKKFDDAMKAAHDAVK